MPQLVELSARGGTFLLGAESDLELENTESLIEAGEGLVVYTDGATDVRRGREMLGLEGLTGVLAPLSGLAARVVVEETERAILAWADRPIRDDLCLVVLRPEPA
jgi:serine phosphatase RsbU (regulator of sigma subunit)